MSPLMSSTSLSRVMGAGGENCHRTTASPGAVAQNATWATRKSPVQPASQLASPPEANAIEPGAVTTPRKLQLLGPLQVSFCNVASKVEMSAVMVLVSTQPADETLTFCSIE